MNNIEILPSSELRNKYPEISKRCKETHSPIFITVNGKGDSVIMSIEDYNKMIAEYEIIKSLNRAEDDVKNGRVTPLHEGIDELKKKYNLN